MLSLLKNRSEDEAIDIANSTEYGLVGGIFTADIDAAHRAAHRIRAGQIFINEWYAGGVETPLAAMANQAMGARRAAKRCGTTCRPKKSPIAQGRFKPRPDPCRRKAIALAAALPPSRRHGCGGREARLPQFRPYWDE